jgi:FtsH-binding integral membrane protein
MVGIEKGFRVAHFNWSPGIGDPTVGGWITVVLYLSASISCWITARKLSPADAQLLHERHAWLAIAVLFLLLGINKQLDLQSALTEIGRKLAYSEGWYPERRFVQVAFIGFVALACLFAMIILLIWARHTPGPTWLALLGTVTVFGFVLIRASSFHHMDRFIGTRILGFRWNWILEMGGISLTLIASVWRRKRETSLAA